MNASDALTSVFRGVLALSATAIAVGVIKREFFPGPGVDSGSSVSVMPVKVADWNTLVDGGRLIGGHGQAATILVFADFQCPYCRKFATRSLQGVLAQYNGEIRVLFRHWPLSYHAEAYPAARAAECAAAQGRFTQAHDFFYAHQDSLGKFAYSEVGQRIGVADVEQFGQCVEATDPVPAIELDLQAVRGLKGNGTPTVLINGRLYPHPPDSIALDSTVRAIILASKAKR